MRALFCFLVILFSFNAAAQESPLKFRLYLIGDAGEFEDGRHPVVDGVEKMIKSNPGQNSHLIYLGDNIYPLGLPLPEDENRSSSEAILNRQLSLADQISGDLWMIPGNHDWEKGKSGGWDAVLRMEEYIEENFLDENILFVPGGGCPGPYAQELDDETVLIVFDSQWWLHSNEKPGAESDCEFKSEEEILASLSYLLAENKEKTIVFAMHHPMRSYGEHNGAFTFKDHLFPLTAAKKNLYIPLPIIGSIYPTYRTVFGDIQDIPHPKYQAMIQALDRIFDTHPNVIQVSGHEHGLFYTREKGNHYIVSGAGAKTTHIKKKNPAEFAYPSQGFAVLDFFEDHRVDLSFFDPSGQEKLYTGTLVQPYASDKEDLELFDREIPKSVSRSISEQYLAGKGHQAFLGTNYRETWAIESEFPVLDLAKEKGGLKIIKRGGGMQTRSLRLSDSLGNEFVLRSVNKYPENALPSVLRKTIAKDVVQDQISSSHPYSAMAVANLADAVGVIHTNPSIVYLPDDPLLGVYRKDFSNQLFLFEERQIARADIENYRFFSTDKMLKQLYKDNDNQVDQREVLKARLFDLWIADWDRHDDQWRWVGTKDGKDWVFVPMPRDRDQAFFVNEGVFPKIASRKWLNPKFQGFNYELKNVNGFMFNGRYFDRSFLTELDKEDWENEIDLLIEKIDNEVIENAFTDWPKEVRDKDASTIEDKLKARRSWLKEKALEYYEFLAKDVSVVGSKKNEHFDVHHYEDGRIHVTTIKITKEGEQKEVIYERIFDPGETEEIRIYGLDGEDQYHFTGKGPGSIKVRIIPGAGTNKFNDEARVWNQNTLVYRDRKTPHIDGLTKSSRNKIAPSLDYLEYNRKEFKYDKVQPLISAEFNQDDGLFLGAGVLWEKQKFKKKPYAIRQSLKANYAFKTNAFNIYYEGHAVDVVGNWDLVWDADVRTPNYVFNYFGQGNETTYDVDEREISYYRSRFNWYELSSGLQRKITESGTFTVGPHYQTFRFDPEDNIDRFITSPESGLDQDDLAETKFYTGLSGTFEFDKRNNEKIPTRGFYFRNQWKRLWGLNSASGNFTRMEAELALYWSFKYASKMVWATRFGGGKNWGDYEFFQGQILGGVNNLRSFRRYRFNGDAVFYNNTEFRLQLLNLKTFVLPATIGVIGFHDIGRVWLEGENSDSWHSTLGFGVWIAPLNQIVGTFSLGFNDEESLGFFSVGYQF